MSRTSETPQGAGEHRCGVCENCRANGPIQFPNCEETADYRCGACANCRAKGPIQFPNCHEVDEIRCSCGKCLAKDGAIKCPKCSTLNVLPPMPSFRQAMAFQLAAKAMIARVLDHNERPVKVTVEPGPGYAGFVEFQADGGRTLMTIEDMKRKLVVLMAGCAAERLISVRSSRDMETAFRQSHDLAMRICDLECAEGDRSKRAFELVTEAMFEAFAILSEHAAEHHRLTTALLEKGELTGADIAGIVASSKK